MSKYDPIRVFLQGLPESTRTVQLGFHKIESVLGALLPPTARVDRPWWANTFRSNHAKSWLVAGWKVSKVDLRQETVSYVRQEAIPAQAARPGGAYERLQTFLSTLPGDQEQLSLTFQEMAKHMGQPLPFTAGHDRPWWANTRSNPQGRAWLSAGWQIERVYLAARTVVLRRKGLHPVRDIPRLVSAVLDSSKKQIHLDTHTGAAWIRFCRQAHWYFEGVVLYERGGLTLDNLSESDRAAVDEDYAVCKRALTLYQRTGMTS